MESETKHDPTLTNDKSENTDNIKMENSPTIREYLIN